MKQVIVFMVLLLVMVMGCEDKRYVTQEKQQKIPHPLTDGIHVDLYTFIGSFLEKQPYQFSSKEVKEWYEKEKKDTEDSSFKPHIADMYEGEMAGILRVFLRQDSRYENITLYTKDGLGISTSGMKNQEMNFDNRPHELKLGFMTDDFLMGPKIYRYLCDKKMYVEKIMPIYKTSQRYCVTQPPQDQGNKMIIGYLSFIESEGQ